MNTLTQEQLISIFNKIGMRFDPRESLLISALDAAFALGVAQEREACGSVLKKLADETLSLQNDSNALDEIILRHRANALKNGEEAIRARK